jgi:uncharacterized membrane protein
MNLLVRRRVLWDYLGGALWVLSTVAVVVFLTARALLSRVSVDADSPLWPLAFQGTGEDARGILVVVSATMITVTGLVFALTIVALQIAAGQYSPRLLRNFLRDRGTQVVLSVFVGAFAYSTAGLHTVGIQRAGGGAFVPRLAVSGSLLLGLASVGVLIYFIHHLARSIQIDAIMSQVEREARWFIDDLYPQQPGYLAPEEHCPDPPASATVLPAGRSGYIQAVQPEPLVRAAADQDVVVRLARKVGDHVVEGTPLAWAWPGCPRAHLSASSLSGRRWTTPWSSGSSGPWSRTSPSGCVGSSTSATRPCRRQSTTPTRASRRSSTCRCCCACWPAGGSATGSTTTSRRRCASLSPSHSSPTNLRLGTAQIRRSGAKEPAVARSLSQLLKDVGGRAVSEDRRRACARHIWLVLEDAKCETAQPADVEAVQADGAAALAALGTDRPQLADD